MNIFVTGTDTNVGKTLISSWLCLKKNMKYFKPVQSGAKDGSDKSFVASIIGDENVIDEVYKLHSPNSPHIAAEMEDIEIDVDVVLAKIESYSKENKNSGIIIEGAGGIYVPLNQKRKYTYINLMQQINIPIVVVARTTLGTINHTLLTLDKLNSLNLVVKYVILNGNPEIGVKETIEYFSDAKVIEFPYISTISAENIKKIDLTWGDSNEN